ncbi:MAG: nitroreductase family protein [Eubacterium sp.]|nr:nitroreductase family protein [Eubacterium sp.]MCM1216361.1 nitroreductase family protein [Lachnospiraceae bacterium]MCM1303409.1 nitroreductase family protein [Butyrivibrio sp.]MCM1342538.1 nitroreductase family protein [Muribaculaceae bacterium]MCM1238211.1 nitroreductase family protein [Lachnospiraceae bacterium]
MEDLMELLATRRTYRRFQQKAVPQDITEEILAAARLASSAANRQPLTYIVIKDPDKVAEVFAHTKWAGALPPEQGQPKEDERPVLFIAVVKNMDINPDCDTDAGLAISNMTLAAWNRGVGSCMIGACNKPALSEMFGLTQQQTLHTVVAFGYPSHVSHIVDMEDPAQFKYYLDENRDYCVPKRKLSDVVRYL